MKHFTILSLLIFFAIPQADAQTFDEWFRQKKTQRKYLIQQIAALKMHLQNMQKGVDIVFNGWNTIQNISDGHFNLHRDFFASLSNVNPHITNLAQVADIMAFQYYIAHDLKGLVQFCKDNKQFTPDEIYYVTKVYYNMLWLCDANFNDLLSIIRANESEMSDDQRIMHINRIYEDMKDKRAFTSEFNNDTRTLAAQRQHEQQSISHFKEHSNPAGI